MTTVVYSHKEKVVSYDSRESCDGVIEELNMTYAEANIFKEIWRTAAARTLGKKKAGHTNVRGAEKILFFAKRNAILNGVSE